VFSLERGCLSYPKLTENYCDQAQKSRKREEKEVLAEKFNFLPQIHYIKKNKRKLFDLQFLSMPISSQVLVSITSVINSCGLS
jgi:hypothetical protein